jgi:hypothetical protein
MKRPTKWLPRPVASRIVDMDVKPYATRIDYRPFAPLRRSWVVIAGWSGSWRNMRSCAYLSTAGKSQNIQGIDNSKPAKPTWLTKKQWSKGSVAVVQLRAYLTAEYSA